MTETEAVTTLADALATVRGMNAYELAGPDYAGCASPDSPDSAGASFLASVRDAVVDAIESDAILDGDSWDERAYEIADAAPDVYTHPKWQEFVDLCAWNEDLDDIGGSTGDMDKDASLCLFIIAARLARALFAELVSA